MRKESFKDLKTVAERVEFLLKNFPLTRENDNQLIATFELYEVGISEIGNMTALDLLAKRANSKLTPPATVIRARQDIQKNQEELRGAEFGKRKKAVDSPLFKVNMREN